MSNFNANSIVSKNIVVENLTVASLNGIPLGINSCGCIDLTCQNEDCQCPSYITSGNEITSGSNINLSNITSDIIPAEGQEISLGGVGREFKELHVKGSTIFIGGSSISTNEETGGINLPASSTINNVTVGTIKIKDSLTSESDLADVEGPAVGDGYIISGNLHVYTENNWKNIGPITGPKGDTGEKQDLRVRWDHHKDLRAFKDLRAKKDSKANKDSKVIKAIKAFKDLLAIKVTRAFKDLLAIQDLSAKKGLRANKEFRANKDLKEIQVLRG